ncbi:MAG: CYTH domain-containing protein [Bacteroidales bacterium]|nr:CYTH domain-containing protein [Bacteroidales bacterium]
MNIETERKFLVADDSFKSEAVRTLRIKQGYIAHDAGRTVRVRIADDKGFLTIKGPSMNGGISRFEWEREIPLQDAEELMLLCKDGKIDKTRFIIPAANGRKFEVDEFYGDNEGLVMAEIELGSEDEAFVRPSWLGDEVTGDKRYYNSHLLTYPFKDWK